MIDIYILYTFKLLICNWHAYEVADNINYYR